MASSSVGLVVPVNCTELVAASHSVLNESSVNPSSSLIPDQGNEMLKTPHNASAMNPRLTHNSSAVSPGVAHTLDLEIEMVKTPQIIVYISNFNAKDISAILFVNSYEAIGELNTGCRSFSKHYC